jgi:hypothetical protein
VETWTGESSTFEVRWIPPLVVSSSIMEAPQVKSEIVQAIQDLPEDATVEDVMERLYFLAKVERGFKESEGETLSHEEIKARFLR